MKTYWYIKHVKHGPLNITFGATHDSGYGYCWSEGDGFRFGIRNVTQFPRKEDALKTFKVLKATWNLHTHMFKLVKVSSKSK